jgi:hypothetical protein
MDRIILQSAFKHGVSEQAIDYCLTHAVAATILEVEPEKQMIVGFDYNGNALEVGVIIKEDKMIAIHSQKLTKKYFYLLEEAKDG